MSTLLALTSAFAYGASDFLAGLMSRRASVFVVALTAQITAATLTWVALPLVGGEPNRAALAWGALSGAGVFGGTFFLYRGLARGRMTVVGPVSAVVTAVGSAGTGVALGDRPTPLEVAGVVVACVAVALVSLDLDPRGGAGPARPARVPLDGVLAGAGFTLLFVGLHRAGGAARLWPVATGQTVGLILFAAGALGLSSTGRVELTSIRRIWRGALGAGVLGGAATIAYFVATQLGLLSISAVLASLYPAATVVLAVVVLRERLRPLHSAGLALAAAAVALLAG